MRPPAAGARLTGLTTLTVIDLGISNIASVVGAFARLGVSARSVRDCEAIGIAKAIVLPGVGAFGNGMAALRDAQLIEPLRAAAVVGTPVLGVCLGMQLMATQSEEGGIHEGLDLIAGNVVRLSPGATDRVPNIGWCDVFPRNHAQLLRDITPGESFYCVHGYHLVCRDSADVAATIRFAEEDIVIAVEKGNLFGVQFHPEKSQDAGLRVLHRFIELARA